MNVFFFLAAPKLNIPPRFRDTAFFDKGENVVIKIPFTGHPKPRITWVREGEVIESGGHYHVEVKDRHAILTIRDGSRLDSGPYRITAENDLGQDSAIIKIQISGRYDVANPIWRILRGTHSISKCHQHLKVF